MMRNPWCAAAVLLAMTATPPGAGASTAACSYRYTIEGNLADAQGRHGDARLAYLRALECDESSAYLQAKVAAHGDQPTARSRSYADQVVQARAWEAGGDHGLLACDVGTALDSALLANELFPHNGMVLASIGRIFFTMGDYGSAITYLQEASSLMPGRSEILERLGDAYSASKEWQKALETYKRIDLTVKDGDAARRLRLKIGTAAAEK